MLPIRFVAHQVYSVQGADGKGPASGDQPGADQTVARGAEDDEQRKLLAAGETQQKPC